MLQEGKNITQLNDPLTKVQVSYLYHAIKNPKPELETAIRQLRLIKTLDVNRYTQLKKNLPYVVCGIFNPPVRRGENFGWISHFMLDLDHLVEKGMAVETLKSMLATDLYIVLMFVSPGNDGLKVLFRLSDKCYDRGKYTLFYKLFARKFSQQYQLEQVVDSSTSDVTRACFLSVDSNAYYNPDSLEVSMEQYIDFENIEQVKEVKSFISKDEKQQIKTIEKNNENDGQRIDEEVLNKIKSQLNPNFKLKKEKQIYVPEAIDQVIEAIIQKMKVFEIETTETINIHYGKKFRFKLGFKQAEINLFYGKRGFSVVSTPRTGTDVKLNELTAQIIGELLL